MAGAYSQAAYDAAWRWFELHSQQRLNLFQYFIALFGALGAAYAAALSAGLAWAGVGVCVLGIVLSMVFRAFDARAAGLVKIAEAALAVEQAKLGAELDYEEIELVRLADAASGRQISYRRLLGFVYAMSVLTFLAGGVGALAQAPQIAPFLHAFKAG